MKIITEPRRSPFGQTRYVAKWQRGRARGKTYGATRTEAMRRAIREMEGVQ